MSLESLLNSLDKAIGPNASEQMVSDFIDTGFPPLNLIVSGKADRGLPFGRLIEMFGESSSGKTALATLWMIQAQRMGGVAIFVDWERSFDVDMARANGLNTDRPYWIYLRPETWEEGNTAALQAIKILRESKIIDKEAPIIGVFDSIAASVPKSMAEKDFDELTMNDTSSLARVTSTTLKGMALRAGQYNATLVYLNQVREAIGVVYGDKLKTPGGRAMEFAATSRLSLTRSKITEQVEGEKEFVGQLINIKCTKSKLTKPFQKCSLRLSFDDDGMARFDFVTSMIDDLVERGVLTASGPRVTWVDGKSYFKRALSEKIQTEGLVDTLKAMYLTPEAEKVRTETPEE